MNDDLIHFSEREEKERSGRKRRENSCNMWQSDFPFTTLIPLMMK